MLCDTGPLLSLIDSKHSQHALCTQILATAPAPLISTWACFAEAMYMLGRSGGFVWQGKLWTMHHNGVLALHEHLWPEFDRMQFLMEKYQNIPMDLADATLMVTAAVTGDRQIFTLDNDFRIYRFDDGGYFDVVP